MPATQQATLSAMSKLRLRGVVEAIEFATAAPVSGDQEPSSGASVQMRDLTLPSTGEPLEPNSCRFRHGAAWLEAGVQPGDTVLFSASPRMLIEPGARDAEASTSSSQRKIIRVFDEQADQVLVIRRPKPVATSPAVSGSVVSSSGISRPVEPQTSPGSAALTHLAPASAASEPPARRMQTKLPLVLVVTIGAVLAALVGGTIGWTLALRQQSPANPSMPQRSIP